jgi:regulator of sigma E protease
MQFLETVLYFVVTLGVLVFVHELGHFLAAKLSGMRVDRFSIGFPPRAFGKQIGETDYCVSWIPIGGYVKIAGMIDESFDAEFVSNEVKEWEFRAKPLWQKLFVLSAGVIMNIVLAVGIFWGINYVQGKTVRETTVLGYVASGSPAATSGLCAGDKVLRVNNTPVADWDQFLGDLFIESMANDVTLTVLRNGQEIAITIPRAAIPETNPAAIGLLPDGTDIMVSNVEQGKPADRVGLKPLDVLVSLNDEPVKSDKNVIDIIRAHADKPLAIEWNRGNEKMSGTVVPTTEGRIGISFTMRYNGPIRRVDYSIFQAFPQAVSDIASISVLFIQQIGQIISGHAALSQSVGGPIRIAQMATQTAELGLPTYLGFMALLSVSLAILNILPFPALDGGHIVVLLIEAIIRREIPVSVKMWIQRIGFTLLLAFMAFVVYNDIMHF